MWLVNLVDLAKFGDTELARVLTSTPMSENVMLAVLAAHCRWIGEGAAISDDISVVVIERVAQTMPTTV